DWTHLKFGRDEQLGPVVGFNLERLGDPVPVQLYTHIIGDPQFHGRPGQSLAFAVRGAFAEDGLTLTGVEQRRRLHARAYSTTVPEKETGPGGSGGSLPLSRFQDGGGRSPARWQDLDKLEIRGKAARKDPPQFARWRWADPP